MRLPGDAQSASVRAERATWIVGARPSARSARMARAAAAPANGTGILGIWPGMRALNIPLPAQISCADSVQGIVTAIKAHAQVINMSYGSPSLCFAEYLAIQAATGAGVTVVAAAGNEFANRNPPEFPASLPHAVTVAAPR